MKEVVLHMKLDRKQSRISVFEGFMPYQFHIVHGIQMRVEPQTLAHPVNLLGLVLGRARL